MATVVLSIAGSYLGGPVGSFLGAALGNLIDRKWIFPREPIRGPRLDRLHVQNASNGVAIPRLWGTMRFAGNMIWIGKIREVSREEGGGACGGGPEQVSYYYFADFAIGICQGPIDRIIRMWADTKLIYSAVAGGGNVVQIAPLVYRVYPGSETQMPDPRIQAHQGIDRAPPHRGMAYIVFDNFPLELFGNRIPNFSFEVSTNATETTDYVEIHDVPASIWGSDDLVVHSDGAHVTLQAGGYWTMVNLLTGAIERQKIHDSPKIPDLSDFDIDERGRIHTTLDSVTPNVSFLCQLDGETYAFLDASAYEFDSPGRIRVSKSVAHPYVVAIATGGATLWITHRDQWVLGGGAGIEVAPPSGLVWQSAWVDGEAGVIWAVASDYLAVAPDTIVAKITPALDGSSTYVEYDVTATIEKGREIIFDADTDQVIVGSVGQQRVSFFDAGDMTALGSVDTAVMSSWPKSTWQRGVIGGYLYFGYAVNEYKRIDVVARAIDKTWTLSPSPGNINGGSVYDPVTNSIVVAVLGSGFNFAIVRLDRAAASPVLLSDIVSDICGDVGLDESSEVEASTLTDLVHGFVVNDRMSARDAIQSLMEAYFFDGVESDGELRFPKRGGAAVLAVPESDLATHLGGAGRPQELVTTRQQETDLPREVEVKYPDTAKKYEVGLQREERLITLSREKLVLELPIGMTADEAKQIAVRQLGLLWTQRVRHEFSLPRKYARLDPADVVTVSEGGNTHTVLLDEVGPAGGVVAFRASNEDGSAYESDASGVPPPPDDEEIAYPGPTVLALIDCPLLKSTHDQPGLYLAALGYTASWAGAIVYKSADGGATWQEFAVATKDAAIGRATDALGDVADPWVWDEGNTLNVRLQDATDTLSSATAAQVLNGANPAILGDEVIQYRTATLEVDGSYTLSGLLRGRKGTEWATGSHVAGDRFVVLDETEIHFVPFPVEDRNLARTYRAVTIGMPFTSGVNQDLTCRIRNMMPLSPQHIEGTRDAAENLTLTWKRRTRYGGEWQDGADVPLGETSEAYEVDILDGSTVVRTINSSTESVSYTAAQQTADGLAPGDPVSVVVYQISSVVGRGFGTEATV